MALIARSLQFILMLALLGGLMVSHGVLAQSRAVIKFVQEKLYYTYGVGSATGVLDGTTRTAIKAYQRDWRIAETGQISDVLVAMLKREHPRTRPQWFRVAGQSCEVWNGGPQPQETAAWTGGCVAGRLGGMGRLTWRWTENGRSKTEIYVGGYQDGRINGHGVYTWSSGNMYDGEWRNGDYHGHGTYVWGPESEWAGDRYKGEYRDGKRHGRGSHKLANGNEYDGEWRDGKRHGQGVFRYADGSAYEGEWRNGKPHGRGVYITADGKREARRRWNEAQD
ncbi:MAG: peptidoglycan-binding protein [Pseudomonadota bacterium]